MLHTLALEHRGQFLTTEPNQFPEKTSFKFSASFGAPGWLSRLSIDFSSGHDLTVGGFEPGVGLWAESSSLETASECVSSIPSPLALCLSLKK